MSVNYKQLKQFRKILHANPELSGNEKETAASIVAFLKTCEPDKIITKVGGHGIIAVWDSKKEGEEILFRSELDALPIEEVNTFGHASKNKGVSHKCGHDGHSTILCGVAQFLSGNKLKKGKVILLFQPAEETGEGAKAVLEDKKFKNIHPDFVFALHNLPNFPMGEIVIKNKIFSAAVNSMIIHLHGKTAHAGEPENGINPALALSAILKESIALAINDEESEDMQVITPVHLSMGEKAYGISAGSASIHLTLRCWENKKLRKLEKKIEQLSMKHAKQHQLKLELEYTQSFHANANHISALDMVRQSASLGGFSITERRHPFRWGEDFGLFTANYKGCMFGLGAGEKVPALHNEDYDFPDELIEKGTKLFTGIIGTTLIYNIKSYV